MAMKRTGRWSLLPLKLAGSLGLAFITGCGEDSTERDREERLAPVAVAPIVNESLEYTRRFSGTLSAYAEFMVSSKVSGRLERIFVDTSDTVERRQVVAEVDDPEFVQEEAQAEADVAVAQAELAQATSALRIAERENQRLVTLKESGVVSDADFDTAQSEFLGAQARHKVAEARLLRAEAELASARIQLGYCQITASWADGDQKRVVAERYVDEGQTVSVNEPILRIVQLDPIVAQIYVTEKDYTRLRVGQPAVIVTDAFPGRTFEGEIQRIAPVFRESTRQANVEIALKNSGYDLKPGMFVRASIVLDRVEGARVIPEAALTNRNDTIGVFVLNEDGQTVRWEPVTVGIQDGDRVQIVEPNLTGRVVTLGQHLVDDGARIVIAREEGDDAE